LFFEFSWDISGTIFPRNFSTRSTGSLTAVKLRPLRWNQSHPNGMEKQNGGDCRKDSETFSLPSSSVTHFLQPAKKPNRRMFALFCKIREKITYFFLIP
jgi:hypothetical protein